MLWIWIIVLVLALGVLIKGADWFTEGAEAVGVRLGMSPFVVGVTIVSIGTSLPELASSIAAVLAGKSEIVLGNVVGSNIANILFVLGLGALVAKGMETKWDIAKVDLPILFGATFLLILTVIDGSFGFIEALVFLAFFAVYIHYALTGNKDKPKIEAGLEGSTAIVALIGGLILVIVGAKFLIDSVVGISTIMGISTAIISASVVAFGTSVPEAVVTIVAALKGKKDIAIGNIVGSNIFNILFIMGVAGLFDKLAVDKMLLTYAVPMLVAATFMFWFVTQDKKVTRWEGATLLILYIFFIAKLFI
ncbi:calcium/sodium antiporter [Candidatus Woesearchaeota archaeon]|nr:calcium/sodium antiporter [Candidatus Woesearchaeota archaeon]